MNQSPEDQTQFRMGFLWRICLVAAMGGLLFGYDWVVIGGARPFYEPYFEIHNLPWWQGFATSSALLGCVLGTLMSGILTDRYGRKRLLILSGLLFTVSAIGTALAWDFTWFNIFRLIGGVGIGLASNLSPMFIAEIAPAKMRGRFVSLNQMTIVIGVLAAQIVNWQIAEEIPTADQLRILSSTDEQITAVYGEDPEFDLAQLKNDAQNVTQPDAYDEVIAAYPELSVVQIDDTTPAEQREAKEKADKEITSIYIMQIWSGQQGWRWMFGAETLLAATFFLLMFFVPESPRWLIKYGRKEEAHRVLAQVGGEAYADFEVNDIQATLAQDEIGQVHFKDLLAPKLFTIVGLGVFLAVLQQWCGINSIFMYAPEIFSAAGMSVSAIMFSIVITGLVNLVFTFVAIGTVDNFGRKGLMLVGAGGLTLIYAVLGTGFLLESKGIHMLILVLSAIGFYAMSLAPMTWVVISEIFPNRIRGAAMSVSVASLWISSWALTQLFPVLNEQLGSSGTFWLFSAICLTGFIVILTRLPETKGKSLEDIERELVD